MLALFRGFKAQVNRSIEKCVRTEQSLEENKKLKLLKIVIETTVTKLNRLFMNLQKTFCFTSDHKDDEEDNHDHEGDVVVVKE